MELFPSFFLSYCSFLSSFPALKGEIECERGEKRQEAREERATGICSESNQGPANTFKTRVKVRGLVKRERERESEIEREKREKKEEERSGM